MDREGMPQIVQPRLVATAIRPLYPRELPQPVECVIQRPSVSRGPPLADEESTPGASRQDEILLAEVRIRPGPWLVPARWDQPRLEELGIPDGDQPVRQIGSATDRATASRWRRPAP